MSNESRFNRKSPIDPGIYLGKVINHLDTKFMGGIEVEILKRTGTTSSFDPVPCRYGSPFFGSTPFSGATNNAGYEYGQKSYGFWAVPPDIGQQVVVVMPEGNHAQAIWIAVVPDAGINFMTPGYSSTTFNKEDTSKPLPVAEVNKKALSETDVNPDLTKLPKPVNPYEKERLETSRLIDDHVRGTNTSSARREAPSMVFGMSTPGPEDREGPTHQYGIEGRSIQKPYNRLGGSSFVMDDGDMSLLRKKKAGGDGAGPPEYASVEAGETDGDPGIPASELIRLKTRTGHQILMHNSEDLIYISHGSGNSWIELSSNGKIDIYAKDSISVRSENDINFIADRDINFEAGNNFNFTAGQNFFLNTGNNWELKAGADGRLTAENKTSINASVHAETAEDGIFMNSGTAGDVASAAKVPVRIPAHEPWPDHEHLDPEKFIPDNTVAVSARTGKYLNGTTDEAPPFPTIPDTFKKPT